jgi:hypothetical protein
MLTESSTDVALILCRDEQDRKCRAGSNFGRAVRLRTLAATCAAFGFIGAAPACCADFYQG